MLKFKPRAAISLLKKSRTAERKERRKRIARLMLLPTETLSGEYAQKHKQARQAKIHHLLQKAEQARIKAGRLSRLQSPSATTPAVKKELAELQKAIEKAEEKAQLFKKEHKSQFSDAADHRFALRKKKEHEN